MPMGQWGGLMLPADWLVETFEAGLWEVDCHSGPGITMEHRAGTALMMDLAGGEKSRVSKTASHR